MKFLKMLALIREGYLKEMKRQDCISRNPSSRKRSKKPDRSFKTKIVGVTFEGRQSYLRSIWKAMYKNGVYTNIKLIRDPNNKHDTNAIKVVDDSGRHLGYISANVAVTLSGQIDGYYEAEAFIEDILGFDDPNAKTLGCLIRIDLYSE